MRALIALLLLTACGESPSTKTGQDPSADEGDAPQPTVLQPVPENLMDDPRNEAVPLDPPPPDPNATPKPAASASAAPVKAFPASFQGRWGLVPNDCRPGRADAKGLMEVGPDSLRFYESRGTVRRLASPRPDRIEATLAFTGEGMEWTAGPGVHPATRRPRPRPRGTRPARLAPLHEVPRALKRGPRRMRRAFRRA